MDTILCFSIYAYKFPLLIHILPLFRFFFFAWKKGYSGVWRMGNYLGWLYHETENFKARGHPCPELFWKQNGRKLGWTEQQLWSKKQRLCIHHMASPKMWISSKIRLSSKGYMSFNFIKSPVNWSSAVSKASYFSF